MIDEEEVLDLLGQAAAVAALELKKSEGEATGVRLAVRRQLGAAVGEAEECRKGPAGLLENAVALALGEIVAEKARIFWTPLELSRLSFGEVPVRTRFSMPVRVGLAV